MPELPEVETTRRGIAPHVVGRRVADVAVRQPRLRYPVPPRLASRLRGREVVEVGRRGKYLWLRFDHGALVVHLGMSGSLCLVAAGRDPGKHDHVDIEFEGGTRLRLHDPRRFGSVTWADGDPLRHPLLAGLGIEPLDDAMNGDYLHRRSRGRRASVKQFIMDNRILTGVGNIYANEALYAAAISPLRAAGRVSLERYTSLAAAIQEVLQAAIRAGGTTLRDFHHGEGRPGYFGRELLVYQREGDACGRCVCSMRAHRRGQRSSFYCAGCQR